MGSNVTRADRVGLKTITNEGYEVEIIEYYSAFDCTFQFKCGLKLENRQYVHFRMGKIKYPFNPTIFNVGYMGNGNYTCRHISYGSWYYMFQRIYKYNDKKTFYMYKDYSISKEWRDFQNFAKWYEENAVDGLVFGLEAKDKIYAPQNCKFVTKEENEKFSFSYPRK